MKYKIVLVRHGQSTWNLSNQFTGWTNVPLTKVGRMEAEYAGKILSQNNYKFTKAHTSVLMRAVATWNEIAENSNHLHIPVNKHWRLNERHYGALQGLNKKETEDKHGKEKVNEWRRSFDISPPALDFDDERHPRNQEIFKNFMPDMLPSTESLLTTIERTLPYYYDTIVPDMIKGEQVIIVAHGNSLRGLVKHFKKLSNDEILTVSIPNSIPYVFEFDKDFNAIKD